MTNYSKKILVCGGAGFIGSNFIRFILKKHKNAKILNYDKLTYSGNLDNLKDIEKDKRYKFAKGDISDKKQIDKTFKNFKPNYIVNFAAETHVDKSIHIGAKEFIDTNITGVFNLLEAVKNNPNVKKYVQVSCYDEKTRALTKEGFKNYWEIKKRDIILSINPQTKMIEEKEIEEVIIQGYSGEMIHFKSKGVDLMVTPNHKIFYTIQNKKIKISEAELISKKTTLMYLPKGGWKGVRNNSVKLKNIGEVPIKKLFYLCGVFIGDGFIAHQKRINPSKSGLSKKERDVIAKDKKTGRSAQGRFGAKEIVESNSWRIFFDVPRNDKARKKLEEILKKLHINYFCHKGRAREHIYFSSKEWLMFFEQFGKGAKNKHIPEWMLAYDRKYLRELFDGLIDSDGYKKEHRIQYTTVSERLVKDICELGFKLGYSPIFRENRSENVYRGRIIKGRAFYVYFSTEKRSISQRNAYKESYQGKIWCLKVKDNKNFIVERNGRLAFCGNTDEVYGSLDLNSKDKFKEDTAFAPNVPYAATKAGGDMLCRAYYKTFRVSVIVTHCSNNYGPYQYPEKLIPFFILRMLENKKLPLYGDGKNVRDWIYVLDHCAALELCLFKGRAGEVYNIGAGNEKNNLEIANLILKFFNRDKKWIEFIQDRPGHDRRYAIDASKIKKELGWRVKYYFNDTFKETIQWYLDNIKWVENVRKKTGVFNPHIDLWKTHGQKITKSTKI
jgi:dTDP-glucose 4,6-dehydratase